MSKPFTTKKFWLVFSLLSAGVLAILFGNKYLPMTDLPQFTAQISMIKELRHADSHFHELYRVQWMSPYILSVVLAYGVSFLTGVLNAVKVVIALSMIGLPLSLVFYLRRSGGYLWWSLLGFPLAFGFCFAWGFISMMVAIPLGVVFLALVLDESYFDSSRSFWPLFLLGTVIFFTHLFVFAFVTVVALPLSLQRRTSQTFFLWSLLIWPLLWFLLNHQSHSGFVPSVVWNWSFSRWTQFPSDLVSTSHDILGTVVGSLIVGSLFLAKPRWNLTVSRSIFIFISVAGFLLVPYSVAWFYLAYQRFSFFILLSLMGSLLIHQNAMPRWLAPTMVMLVVMWLSVEAFRLAAFDAEAKNFDQALAAVEKEKTLCSLVVDNGSPVVGGTPYLHFPVWATVDKSATTAFSFAIYPNWVVQYKNHSSIDVASHGDQLVWWPQSFHWARDGQYDYYMIRLFVDPAKSIFGADVFRVNQVAQSGPWWLYQRKKLKSDI